MVWGSLIAWYLFLAGMSAGISATCAYLNLRYPSAHKVRVLGRVLAFVALAIGLVLLMLDAEAGLANPMRFLFLVMNPMSVMTIGVYIICVYMVVLLVSLLLDVLRKPVPKFLNGLAFLCSICLAAYTGFLLGAATPYPLWSNGALPILFVISGGSAGLAATLILGRTVDPRVFAKLEEFERLGVVLPVVELFVLFCMLVMVYTTSPEGVQSVMSLVAGEYAILFWGGLVALGLVFPLIVEIAALKTPGELKYGSSAVALSYASNAGVLIGGFLLRYLVITAAVVTLVL